MPTIEGFWLNLLKNLFEIVRKFISLVCSITKISQGRTRRTMRNNVVNFIVNLFKIANSNIILFIAGHFLWPPAFAQNPKHSHGVMIKFKIFLLKIWVFGVKNTIRNIVRCCTAECKEFLSVNVEYLTTTTVQNVVRNSMNISTMPFFDRILIQSIKVRMVSVYKQNGIF